MTHDRAHVLMVAAGLIGLAALACLLWNDEPEPVAVREAVMGPEPVPSAPSVPTSRVTTYDGGRTTIKPLISDAALARRRVS